MPTYEYACTRCGHHVEVVQSMSDAPLTECSLCGGALRRVFSPIGIVFKGSGFYRTDSRNTGRSGAKDKDAAASGGSAGPAGTKDGGSKEPASGGATKEPKGSDKPKAPADAGRDGTRSRGARPKPAGSEKSA